MPYGVDEARAAALIADGVPADVVAARLDPAAAARRARSEDLVGRAMTIESEIVLERTLAWVRRRRALGLPTDLRYLPDDLKASAIEDRIGRMRSASAPVARRPRVVHRRGTGRILRASTGRVGVGRSDR